jgi:hypothetical protein
MQTHVVHGRNSPIYVGNAKRLTYALEFARFSGARQLTYLAYDLF